MKPGIATVQASYGSSVEARGFDDRFRPTAELAPAGAFNYLVEWI